MKLILLALTTLMVSAPASPLTYPNSSPPAAHDPKVLPGFDGMADPPILTTPTKTVVDEHEEACFTMCDASLLRFHPQVQRCKLDCGAASQRRRRDRQQAEEGATEHKNRRRQSDIEEEPFPGPNPFPQADPNKVDTHSLGKLPLKKHRPARIGIGVPWEPNPAIDDYVYRGPCLDKPWYQDRLFWRCFGSCASVRKGNVPGCRQGCIRNAAMRCRLRTHGEANVPAIDSSDTVNPPMPTWPVINPTSVPHPYETTWQSTAGNWNDDSVGGAGFETASS
ncbi:hypothetical protein CDEST_06071 [Colletotrichum destructivum]|uniref:Uncharacterized protein n=1 Tax=Colletotrichum destructivum TaxID=34406 RepID=A0AAX4ICF0_9PEZI|nr:hypothetical protein CDEST_06071 [Colletotrichum destructivum]